MYGIEDGDEMGYATDIQKLVGKVITEVRVSEDWIVFFTKDEVLAFRAVGDCCSKSWIENFSGLWVFTDQYGNEPCPITRVEDINMAVISDHPVHDCLQLYGVKLHTRQGYAFIEFRNSSNGYYGGDLELAPIPADEMPPVFAEDRWA